MRTSALFTIGLSLLLFGGCGKNLAPKVASPPAGDGDSQPQVISIFTLVGYSETGRRKWEVQGKTANLVADLVDLSPVTAKSFGQVELVITAKRGRFNKQSQDAHLEEEVVATTSDGARLACDTFDWKAKIETGTTPDWVTVTRPGMTVVGKGGVGFPKLKRVRLQREVTVTLQGKTGKTVITCDGPMEVDDAHRKARFWRNVYVQDARGTIRSDRMDVRLDPAMNQLRQVTCWGHVKIHDKQRSAFCDRANYWQVPGKTLLAGHPKLAMLSENDQP